MTSQIERNAVNVLKQKVLLVQIDREVVRTVVPLLAAVHQCLIQLVSYIRLLQQFEWQVLLPIRFATDCRWVSLRCLQCVAILNQLRHFILCSLMV